MIREERAHAIEYDAQRDEARLVLEEPSARATSSMDDVDLLLDSAGLLVGVDLGGSGFGRTVVMHGPHEAVASTRPARVTITREDGRICSVAIPGASHLVTR